MQRSHPITPTPIIAAVAVLSGFVACTDPEVAPHGLGVERGSISSEPFAAQAEGQGASEGFEALTAEQCGIDFIHPLDLEHPLKRLYHGGFATGGIAVGDLDGDGLPDLYFVSGPAQNRLYRNLGGFRFEAVDSAELGGGDQWGAGAAMADVDGDGDLDLYVCNYQSPNQLFVNQGGMRFTEQAGSYGLDLADASLMPSFCDYDNDGDLDCFVLTYRLYREGGWPQEKRFEMRGGTPAIKREFQDYYRVAQSGEVDGEIQWSVEYAGRRDRLFRNEGGGQFTDVSEAVGISERGHGLSATWWDADRDGWIDLYVGNDFNEPDRFYRNLGDGTFRDVVREAVPHTSWFSMGADFADLDNDGRFDFLIGDMSSRTHFGQKVNMGAMGNSRWFLENADPRQYMRNALYINSGTWRFQEAAYLAGLADTDWTWAVKLADFDNDGSVDAFFTNGSARNFTDSDRMVGSLRGRTQWDAYEDGPRRDERNLAFKNLGQLAFEDVSAEWGLDHEGVSYAAAYGDLDRDGDLDLIVSHLDEPVSVYRNQTSGKSIGLELRGAGANRLGFGATVELRSASGIQVRQLAPASGFLSSNEPSLHFGCTDPVVDVLTVRWPGGAAQRFTDLPTGRRYRISEGSHQIEEAPRRAPLFVEKPDAIGGHRHREQAFDDFAVQPLLPNRLSRLGPGAALGPGGLLWLGGAKGQAGELRRAGELVHRFEEDAGCEDMGAVFFDADGDGDSDLYVVSGGVECAPGDPLLRDRLYLSDGAGGYQKSILPDLRDSGGPVAAADFDRDGDLDLFVGGRSVPGRYPMSPVSRLLVNSGGRFTDQAQALAPELAGAGMVTSAIWSDIDDDGWVDLLAAYEWGPVRIWKNHGGMFRDESEESGTSGLLGWWNSIAAGDLDVDGDIDFVLGNAGENSKYHTPAFLYYGDFNASGSSQIIEAEYEGDILYPVRGKSCSTQAIPGLAEKFKSYREFAAAPLGEIYTEQLLDRSLRLVATTLESGILKNDGGGRFTFLPFEDPIAQMAPVFGTAVGDFNGDGIADLFLAQNSFSPQPETGRMDGGLSVVMIGDGGCGFSAMRAVDSGIAIAADAKCAVLAGKELLVGANDGRWRMFERASAGAPLVVGLQGPGGNPQAIGARIRLFAADELIGSAEVVAGGGYLSQSPAELSFPKVGGLTSIEVRWPDGTETEHLNPARSGRLLIRREPAAGG